MDLNALKQRFQALQQEVGWGFGWRLAVLSSVWFVGCCPRGSAAAYGLGGLGCVEYAKQQPDCNVRCIGRSWPLLG